MNTIHTKPSGFIHRLFERLNVAVQLHYIERDLAYERSVGEALPAKVRGLERHAEYLRVRQAVLRSS